MTKIWTSDMKPDLKKRFFLSTVESILLYGCESWSMTETQERSLNGTYTRMLRKALNIHWSAHITNEKLYGKLPPVCKEATAGWTLLQAPRTQCTETHSVGTEPWPAWEKSTEDKLCGHAEEGHWSHQCQRACVADGGKDRVAETRWVSTYQVDPVSE